MPAQRSLLVVLPFLGVLACASPTAGTPTPAPDSPPAAAGSAAGGSTPTDRCPLTAVDLSTATALSWELRQTEKANVCVYTTADRPQQAGDPLVLRVDTVTGADAATLRANFEESCTGFRGAVENSTAVDGAEVCRRDGSVVEGNIARDNQAIDIYLVNADADTAASLTPSFEKILAAAG